MYRDGPKAHEASFAAVLDALGPVQGERVLEIGCGPGVLLQRILAAGGTAVGLDHSPDMLALCMARNQEAIADERLQLKLGDAAEIPWAQESFTAAVSANMFFFLYDPRQGAARASPRPDSRRASGDRDRRRTTAGAIAAQLVAVPTDGTSPERPH